MLKKVLKQTHCSIDLTVFKHTHPPEVTTIDFCNPDLHQLQGIHADFVIATDVVGRMREFHDRHFPLILWMVLFPPFTSFTHNANVNLNYHGND